MLQNFAFGVIKKVLMDKEIQQFIKDLIGGVIAEKVIPLLPFALGSAMKRFGEMIPGVEVAKDAVEFADDIREDINKMIPETGFKPIDDFVDILFPEDK